MPSHDSPIIFLLAGGPAMFLAVILHELGHVLAARCVGIDVAAWGVGYRRPWFYCNIGSSVFYLGRPLSGGMMISLPRKLEHDPVKEFIMVLGGPLASLLGLLAGIAGVCIGQRSAVIYAWTYVSAIYVLISLVPYTFTSKSFRFDNDAKRLIRILRRGREVMAVPVGPALLSAQCLAELMLAIRCESGLSNSYSSIAILQSALGDASSAKTNLAASMEGKHRGSISYVAHSAVAATENSDDAETVFSAARVQCEDDATAEFLIDLLQEQWRLKRNCGDAENRERLRQRALAVSRRDWMCWIECLDFETEASNDVESHCRALLQNYGEELDGVTRARLLALTSERLATKGDFDRAVILFKEAQAAISREAAGVASESTRNAYLQTASEPLRQVANLANIDAPRFDECPIQDMPYRRRVFATVALALSISALGAAALRSILILMDIISSNSGFAIVLVLPAVLGAMLGLFAGMISILRSESNRWRILSTALPLAFIAMVVVAFQLSKK